MAKQSRAELVDRLDKALMRTRRLAIRPELIDFNVPTLGRPVSATKLLACSLIGEMEYRKSVGESVAVKDVANMLDLEHSTASRLLGELESEGLIERGVDPEDRRRTTIHLTETGQAVVHEMSDVRLWVMQRMLEDWKTDEIAQIAAALEDLIERFHEQLPEILVEVQERFVEHPPQKK